MKTLSDLASDVSLRLWRKPVMTITETSTHMDMTILVTTSKIDKPANDSRRQDKADVSYVGEGAEGVDYVKYVWIKPCKLEEKPTQEYNSSYNLSSTSAWKIWT